jgi:hypothetical protein
MFLDQKRHANEITCTHITSGRLLALHELLRLLTPALYLRVDEKPIGGWHGIS